MTDLVLKVRYDLRDRVGTSPLVNLNLSAIAKGAEVFLEFCQVQNVPPRGVLMLKMLSSGVSALTFHDVLLVTARRYARRLGFRSVPVSAQDQSNMIRRWEEQNAQHP